MRPRTGPTPPEPQNVHWETFSGNEFVYGASRYILGFLVALAWGEVFLRNARNSMSVLYAYSYSYSYSYS